MAREYKPGSRKQSARRYKRGIYVEERMAWVTTMVGQSVLMYYPEGSEIANKTTEPGPTVKVLIPRQYGAPVAWDLTSLTFDELNAMREFFDLVFDTAEPVVRMRDKVAQDAVAEGDSSITRIYRPVPQLVVRPRPEPKHSESVLDGHENVPEGDDDSGSDDSPDGGVRGSGSVVADVGTEDCLNQDDGEEAH